MNLHTPSEQVKTAPGFSVAIAAATTSGTSVDCQGFETAKAIFNSAPSGVGTTSDCKLQESDDNAAFVDVDGGAFATVTTVGGGEDSGDEHQALEPKTLSASDSNWRRRCGCRNGLWADRAL